MNRTYQPWIIKKANEILEVIKDDVKPTDHSKDRLCMIMTKKFIAGNLSEDDNVIFDSEDEAYNFVYDCFIYETLTSLKEKGLIDNIDNEETGEDMWFLTKIGKKYIEQNFIPGNLGKIEEQ